MKRIVLKEIPKKNICSCNYCSARNYQSTFSFANDKIVDKLYELQISTMCICLCGDCLEELQNTVGDFLQAHPTEKGGVE